MLSTFNARFSDQCCSRGSETPDILHSGILVPTLAITLVGFESSATTTESINVEARNKTRSRSQLGYRGRYREGATGVARFLWGIGLGLGAGVLLAPASGRETRTTIAERATELADNAKSKYDNVRRSVTGTRAESGARESTGT